MGLGEAFVRFYFDDADPARRARIASGAIGTVALVTTVAAALAAVFAAPLSRLLLGFRDPLLLDAAVVGLWAFTNLEMAYAQLRVDERARAYLIASGSNVALTVLLTVGLVVFAGQGARGLLLGNFGASALVVCALLWSLRGRFSLGLRVTDLAAMVRFGGPTVPADASVYALQVADRFYLYRAVSHTAAGEYSIALQLATVVYVFVRGFQYAWPPLAYSIANDDDAARLYALVATYFALATGAVVAGVWLLGRWLVRLLAAPAFFGAHAALPWLALAWSLYGLYQVMLALTGRARATMRNVPAALAGLALNIALLLVLVPRAGAGLGIAGAGIALCGAYVAMLGVMLALTRNLLPVRFEWRRLATLAAIFAGVAASGELLLPTHGAAGLLTRIAWLAWIPLALLAGRFFSAHERTQAAAALVEGRRRVAAFRARGGDIQAYAEDQLRDV
jgi:O-antigen/teichoic acid export membrane protein